MISELSKVYLPAQEAKIIHAIQEAHSLKYLDSPMMSTECVCPICGGTEGYAVFIDPAISDKRMWFCSERNCLSMATKSRSQPCPTIPKARRSLEWPLFCEFNGIGDLAHDITFEKIQQSPQKIEYLLKFAKAPRGIIYMVGDPGTGKTYSCLGLCELFTRTSTSCRFFSSEQLFRRWLNGFKDPNNLREQVIETSLLVIDDFGIAEPPTGFMSFFMEIINQRIQWSNRGTVITTNLDAKKFSKFCGEALSDRINTGQKFEFKDISRRKKTIL